MSVLSAHYRFVFDAVNPRGEEVQLSEIQLIGASGSTLSPIIALNPGGESPYLQAHAYSPAGPTLAILSTGSCPGFISA
eukprot:6172965-Pleurochrysis_carterae.AAC.2